MINSNNKTFYLFFILALVFNFSFVSCLKEPTLPTKSSSTYNSGSGSTGTNTGGTNTGGNNTGGNNTGSGPATGKISVKIYYQPGGSCQATGIDHTLRFYYYCAHGSSSNSVAAGIWSFGEDADGKYKVCLFGNEQSMLCGHGSTLYNRIFKLEWSAHPDKSSYPNSCIISGVANIDFQDQMKNVVIKWY